MPYPVIQSNAAKDTFLAGFLVTAPAWAPSLANLNEMLTTVTLLCGALLGIGRLWIFAKRRLHSQDE